MFASKTDELISCAERATYARQPFQAFKPAKDTRSTVIRTHGGRELDATTVPYSAAIKEHLLPETQLVLIDEGQLFDKGLSANVLAISDRGIRVVVAGLSLNWRGEPWEPMPSLMAVADHIIQLYAVCTVCGADATRSQRLTASTEEVLIGSTKHYTARCREHFSPTPLEAV